MATTISRIQLSAEQATLLFLCWSQYNHLFKRHLKVQHALADGKFCTDTEETFAISTEMCNELTNRIEEILQSETPIELVSLPRDEVIDYFNKKGFSDKIGILKTWQDDFIPCIRWGEFIDYRLEQMSIDKKRLMIFELRPYSEGFVARHPIMTNPLAIGEWRDPKVFHDMFHEYKEWAHLINCDDVSKLNQIIYTRKVNDVKWIAEQLHNQKFAQIADHLCKNFQNKPIVTIAGPSSSNKTTFSLRLAISLRVNGYNSLVIGMDDYYKNRNDIPVGPDGLQDFEAFDALNTALLGEHVKALLEGKKIPKHRFDFVDGVGIDSDTEFIQLKPNTFLILEGIHGLNPNLLNTLGRSKVTPIYVSCLTPINIDDNHRFPTSDLRLIRRMIRDYKYRGYSPRKTLARWTSVRVGEIKNIFPYQQNAELFFNSALVYEIPVLSIFGKALLSEATFPDPDEDPNSPETKSISQEARRLLSLLNLFYPISLEVVPHISCIREFVGGSDLKY